MSAVRRLPRTRQSLCRLGLLGLLLTVSGCDNVSLPKSYLVNATEHFAYDEPSNRRYQPAGTPPPVDDVRWRIDPRCRGRDTPDCPLTDWSRHDFVTVSLSGGGTKASVFGGEALFDMQALGILQRVSMVSSVSGGSFAAALFALSCDDPAGYDCHAKNPLGRPEWSYEKVMRTLGKGNGNLLQEQILRVVPPFLPTAMVISGRSFADSVEQRFLRDQMQAGRNGPAYTFADLNPARPPLYLNATIISDSRVGLEDSSQSCQWLGSATDPGKMRRYLARRTPDETFHFAFSYNEFRAIDSDRDAFPLSEAIAASAGFPALFTPTLLTNFCDIDDKGTPPKPDGAIQLVDGGLNDNQGIIEPFIAFSAFALGQSRYPIPPGPRATGEPTACRVGKTNPANPNCMDDKDVGLFFVVNSAVTEQTGLTAREPHPHFLWQFVESLYAKILSSTDTYSGEAANLRGQLYRSQESAIEGAARTGKIKVAHGMPIEISLLSLDQYATGGNEANRRIKSGIDISADGKCSGECRELARMDWSIPYLVNKIASQGKAYRALMGRVGADRAKRQELGLSDYHPQCYYDIREQLDSALSTMSDDDQACIREAARWSMMLAVTQLCNVPPEQRPATLKCDTSGLPMIDTADPAVPAILRGHLPGHCKLYGKTTANAPRPYAVLESENPVDPMEPTHLGACARLPATPPTP